MRTVTGVVIVLGAGVLAACAARPPQSIAFSQPQILPGTPLENAGTFRGYKRIVIDGQERYCRNDLATGSHTERKAVCLTEAQWRTQQALAEQLMLEIERRAASTAQTPYYLGGMSPSVRQ